MAHLNVSGSGTDRKVEIDPSVPVVIGRDQTATIQVDDRRASRLHARVVVEGSDFVLQDLESTNGTLVNEKRVTRHVLTNGDVVRIGAVRLEFQGGPATSKGGTSKGGSPSAAPKVDLGTPRPKKIDVKLESGKSRRRPETDKPRRRPSR
jgi:pSer/pThr/pTyr-binding forkhead associated (FHA) protein